MLHIFISFFLVILQRIDYFYVVGDAPLSICCLNIIMEVGPVLLKQHRDVLLPFVGHLGGAHERRARGSAVEIIKNIYLT